MNTQEKDALYIANTYGRFPVTLVKGEGSFAYDEAGKRYIDLGTGIAVNTFGYADPVWQKAVTDQLSCLQHASNLYYTQPQVALAELLIQKTGLCKVFFGNSGAEANECAIKVARKYGTDRYGQGHDRIITLKNSFHGRTVTTLSATGQDVFHTSFTPFTEGFLYAQPNDIEDLREEFKDGNICGVLMEVVQGEGGVTALDGDYVRAAKKLCEQHDALFMVDEVQTGNGRCGTLYAYQQYGILPDVVTTAKGLGGGLPIGACLIGEKAKDTLGAGSHGSTFGGNPVCAAGAVSILSRLNEDFLASVREKAAWFREKLAALPNVKAVSGLGFMIGLTLTGKTAKEVANQALQKGLLVLTAKEKVRLLPALNISKETLEEALTILQEVLDND